MNQIIPSWSQKFRYLEPKIWVLAPQPCKKKTRWWQNLNKRFNLCFGDDCRSADIHEIYSETKNMTKFCAECHHYMKANFLGFGGNLELYHINMQIGTLWSSPASTNIT